MASRRKSRAGVDENSWAQKKFISHDGMDEQGVRAEVAVFKGYGKIDPYSDDVMDESSKSALIYFTLPENLEHDIYGALSTKNKQDEFVKILHKVQTEGVHVHYRIESVRRRDQERTTPFSVLAENAIETLYRNLVAISFDGETWHWSGAQVTNPAEDKSPDGKYSAFDNPVSAPPVAPTGNYKGTSAIDPPPYVNVRSDGTMNLSGYGANVPFNILGFVLKQMKANNITPSVEWAQKISKRILDLANYIQVGSYGNDLKEADLSLPSHTKIRSVVFEVIETLHPITEEAVNDVDAETAWVKQVYATSLELWNWSLNTSEPYIVR